MSLPPTGPVPLLQSANQQTPVHGRWRIVFSATCASIALVAAALWMPVMEMIARMLRPPELTTVPAYRDDVTPFQQAALTRATVIVIASFLIIMALAALAVLLGRKARQLSGTVATIARMEKWTAVCLTTSLVGLGFVLTFNLSSLPAILSLRLHLPPAFNQLLDIVLYRSPAIIVQALVAITATGAMGCFILSAIAARHGQRWRTPIGLVASALILLAWFASTALVARFIVGFYLHLVR